MHLRLGGQDRPEPLTHGRADGIVGVPAQLWRAVAGHQDHVTFDVTWTRSRCGRSTAGPVALLRGRRLHRQPVGEVVPSVPRVSFDPPEGQCAALVLLDQGLPQVTVGHGLLLRVEPVPRQPALPPPVAEAIDDIRRVTHDLQGTIERSHRVQNRSQFHALVGGLRCPAAGLWTVRHDPGPPTRTGIAGAGAVGIDDGGLGHGSPLVYERRKGTGHRTSDQSAEKARTSSASSVRPIRPASEYQRSRALRIDRRKIEARTSSVSPATDPSSTPCLMAARNAPS